MANPKNPANIAAVFSALIGDIFDLTQTVYGTLENQWQVSDAEYTFGDGRYISRGQAEREFRDKLNYSALVVDYGLAEIFAGVLGAAASIQSASISLTSAGQVSISGEKLDCSFPVEAKTVATPSLAVQEGIYTAELLMACGEFTKWSIDLELGIATRIKAAEKEAHPVIEAL
ncbi:MAG: hypothetical protein LBL76_10460 [Treponema sp.]|jgi:hypothetical protein|nr:hypothetical protein [Treponema sp.]